MPTRPVLIEISPGELVDRVTILEIKQARIADPQKRRTIDAELDALRAVCARSVKRTLKLDVLTGELRCVNESLWDVEDAIRDCERRGDFGPEFIRLARSVYRENDRRGALKRQINELLGAAQREEKQYALYASPADAPVAPRRRAA